MRRRVFVIICLLAFGAQAAPKEELDDTKNAIATAQEKQQKIAQEQKKIAEELNDLQQKMVELAARVQASEAKLTQANNAFELIEKELADKEKQLKGYENTLAGLMTVAVRFSHTPPEAMVMMPGEGMEKIKASRAVSMIAADIKTVSEHMHAKLADLEKVKATARSRKQAQETQKQALSKDQEALKTSVAERKKIKNTLDAQDKEANEKIKQLADKAKNLEALLRSLNKEALRRDKEEKRKNKHVVAEEGIAGSRGKLRSFEAAKGQIRMPVSGRIISEFGDHSGANDTSKGILIDAQENATVVAPFDAEVAYSGTFLNYGKMVILKHRGASNGDQIHTLLAGLARIDVATGDFLLEGEPIGAMGGNKARLYVELRKEAEPINPAGWIKGI